MSHIMIKGHPCKCVDYSTSKTGKHGHAKAHIVALDIFTGKKYEDLCPTSHNVEVPFVKKMEYQLLNADDTTGEVSCLDGDVPKDDLNLPSFIQDEKLKNAEEDPKVTADVMKMFNDPGDGNVGVVIVQSACGMEKIMSAASKKA